MTGRKKTIECNVKSRISFILEELNQRANSSSCMPSLTLIIQETEIEDLDHKDLAKIRRVIECGRKYNVSVVLCKERTKAQKTGLGAELIKMFARYL